MSVASGHVFLGLFGRLAFLSLLICFVIYLLYLLRRDAGT